MKGIVNGNKISINNKGITKNGKFTDAFRLRPDELCIYGNINFPNSPANYKLSDNYSALNAYSWSNKWYRSFKLIGFDIEKKLECENIWKSFIKSATIEEIDKSIIQNLRKLSLGILINPITKEIADTLGLKNTDGALVSLAIENAPAYKAGIRPGDIILKKNGFKIKKIVELPKLVAGTPVGDSVKIEIWRDGKIKTLNVKLNEQYEKNEKKNYKSVLNNNKNLYSSSISDQKVCDMATSADLKNGLDHFIL